MKIKITIILIIVETFAVSLHSSLGISLNSWDPITKFFVLLVGLFTFCLLLFFISQHEKVKIEMKWFLRIIIVFFIICFILVTITEFTGN